MAAAAGVHLATPRPGPLVVSTGRGGSGLLRKLIKEWNDDNPRTPAVVEEVGQSTFEEREAMLLRAKSGWGDVLHLDSIYVSEFATGGWLASLPTSLIRTETLPQTLTTCRRSPGDEELFAVPFNTDIGLVFADGNNPNNPVNLAGLLDGIEDRSERFIGQFGQKNEAFLINVFEHALAAKEHLLDEDGRILLDAKAWNEALVPLKEALAREKIYKAASEADTTKQFNEARARGRPTSTGPYMRNWPFDGWGADSTDPPTVAALQHGVLGGQNLALVAESSRRDEAIALIDWLTSRQSQRDLAGHGLVPVNREVMLERSKKHPVLVTVESTFADARPRPITPRYFEFSTAFQNSLGGLIADPAGFVLSEEAMEKLRSYLV